MAIFSVGGRQIDLPAVVVRPNAASSDRTAWLDGVYVTLRLTGPVAGLRVHTDGKEYPGRKASALPGAWVAIGDVIGTSSELASSRSLPAADPQAMTAFTHVAEVGLPAQCVVNVGRASAKFGGRGGGFQLEYVSGPRFTFRPLADKHWHGRAGTA